MSRKSRSSLGGFRSEEAAKKVIVAVAALKIP